MSILGVPRVAVIGGGCSGTLLAAELVRNSSERPCEVVVVDPCETPGRGVAYGTSCSSHLLNVPAGQMSAYHDRPEDFVSWAHGRGTHLSTLSFAPRMLYGDYLQHVWREARGGASAGASLVHLRNRVVAVEQGLDGTPTVVRLEGGESIDADHVVLAMGNLPPSQIPWLPQDVADGIRYVADPWRPGALESLRGSLLLIGTGLTAIDVVLALDDRGWMTPIHALSRHGLLPRAHRVDTPTVRSATVIPSERSVRGLIGWLRRSAEQRGDWRGAIDELRPYVAEIWRALSDEERRRFLRHAARLWEVHRHRMAPEVAGRIDRLMAVGRLRVEAGVIDRVRETTDGVEVRVRRRGGGVEVATVDHLINCTGPGLNVTAADDRFLSSLLASGLVRPGPYGLGLDVANDGAVISARGTRSLNIWAIGPLRRGVEWETTAAREIRSQAVALAPLLSRQPGAGAADAAVVPADLGAALRVWETMAGAVTPADVRTARAPA